MSVHSRNLGKTLQSKKLFVFDFDGVIADSIEVKTEAFRSLYEQYGERIAQKVVDHHRANGGMSRYDKFTYYHQAFLDIKLNQRTMDELCDAFSELVVKKVIASPEINGIRLFLDQLYNMGKTCAVNSATPQEEIELIVHSKKLAKYFSEIYGSPSSKKQNLKNLIRQYGLASRDVVFFGDDTADMLAAEELNIEFIGVGVNSKKVFQNSDIQIYHLENFLGVSLQQ